MFAGFFSLEGKNRDNFVACDMRKESSERTGDKNDRDSRRIEKAGRYRYP